VHQSFVAALADGFDAGMQTADLGSERGKAVLDAWVNQHTGGLIEKSAIEPDPSLVVVLQNAVLFAAKWRTPFEAAGTYSAPFALADGRSVDVETMHLTGEFSFAQLDGGWTAVRLPYQEGAHAELLLPPVGVDPAEATPELLAQAAERLSTAPTSLLSISLPTIDVSGGDPLDLIESGVFERAGIQSTVCGGNGTDLSGIAEHPGVLCVGQAAQQATLQVGEDGTVAAAVTEIGVVFASGRIGGQPLQFDRPFLFTIVHEETGWSLFQAAIRDPRH
ncbi:MAG: serpin family protein, partial [Actinobacteria bacterium]|nr:serpin family protein [Actinomycetota bacterium]